MEEQTAAEWYQMWAARGAYKAELARSEGNVNDLEYYTDYQTRMSRLARDIERDERERGT